MFNVHVQFHVILLRVVSFAYLLLFYWEALSIHVYEFVERRLIGLRVRTVFHFTLYSGNRSVTSSKAGHSKGGI
jgi:hypothetical protein